MDIRVNDILVMKKPHPCGEKRWLVLRTGADFRLRCLGCGHELMTPRFKAEKISAPWSGKKSPIANCRGRLAKSLAEGSRPQPAIPFAPKGRWPFGAV